MNKENWLEKLQNLPVQIEEVGNGESVMYCKIDKFGYMYIWNYRHEFFVRKLSQSRFYYYTLENCEELLDFLVSHNAVEVSREDIPDYYFQK